MQQFESFSTNVSIVGVDLLRAFYRLFYLQFCDSSDQSKNSVAKVLLVIWEIFLHENNRNYNSYKFSYKLAFIVFLSFLTNQKQEFLWRNFLTCCSCSYYSSMLLLCKLGADSTEDMFKWNQTLTVHSYCHAHTKTNITYYIS